MNTDEIVKTVHDTLNGIVTKVTFDYAISLITKIKDPKERLAQFNYYIEDIYTKCAKGDVDQALADVISRKEQSPHLRDFLKSFGSTWKAIKANFSDTKSPKALVTEDSLLEALRYADSGIKQSALKDTSFPIPENRVIELIKSLELDVQKQKFLTPEEIQRFGFTRTQIADIISNFSHDNTKMDFIDKKLKELGIGSKEVTTIVSSLKFDSNKMKFLNPRTFKYFNLNNINATNILKSLQKDENKMTVLSSPKLKELELQNQQICSVIRSLEDDKNKLSFLNRKTLDTLFNTNDDREKRSIVGEIATSLEKDESKLKILTPKKIEELGLRNFNVAFLASTLTSDDNKIKVIKQAAELKLNSKNIARIVGSLSSDNLKVQFLDDSNYKFDPGDRAKIVSSLSDVKKVKQYLESPELEPYKNAILLGLHSTTKTISTQTFDSVCELADLDPKELHDLPIPVLPDRMTVGVELELIGHDDRGNQNAGILRKFRTLIGGFISKVDTSLSGYNNAAGVEIISPILMNHNLENLNLVSKLVQKNGLGVNDTCGAHVHIGADYLDSVEAWKNLYEIWGNNEDLMYQITNEPGSKPRQGMAEYAKPISPKMAAAVKNGSVNLASEKDLDKFIKDVQQLQWGPNKDQAENPGEGLQKYFGLNFKNTNSVNKNTIEFRLPNGTTNPQTLMHNIRLFTRIVDISKRLGDIEIALNAGHKLTPEQENLFLAREALTKIDPNNPEARLDALLNLLFEDDSKSQSVYVERYQAFPKETLSQFKFDHFSYRNWYEKGNKGIRSFLEQVQDRPRIKQDDPVL